MQWSVVDRDFPPPQKLPNEIENLGFSRYAISDGTSQSQDAEWFLRYDDGDGDGEDNAQYADKTGTDIIASRGFKNLLITTSTGDATAGASVDGTDCSGVKSIETEGSDNLQACFKDGDNRDDGCAIRVKFENGKLDRVNLACFTDDSGDAEAVKIEVYAGLRESCVNIAQTEAVPNSAIGLTDHLWSNGKYVVDYNASTLDSGSPLNYPYSLLNPPFGSLGMSSLVPQQLVNIFSHYDKTTFDPPPAIVGSPFSCSGSGRKCLETHSLILDETVVGPASGEGLIFGKTALGGIFAKLDSVWNWNNLGSYAQNTAAIDSFSGGGEPYNRTENLTNLNNAPKIHPLGTCKTGGKCLEASANGFTLNGKSAGNVVFSNNVAPVNLKFYAFADKNQMPIRKMQVDWGDGGNVALDGYFRNKRGAVNGVCGGSANTCFVSSTAWDVTIQDYATRNFDTKQSCTSNNDCRYLDNCFSESLATNFGQIADKTCDNAYFRFDHVYQCQRDGVGWTTTCPDSDTQSLFGGCCVFQPKVQVKDNWGWCNGTCGGNSSPGRTGCYDKSWAFGGENECDSLTGPYTTFAGRVIVAPQP